MQKRLRFTKRTLALALVLVMALGVVPLTAAASDYENHWSKEFIDDAIARGWMGGYEDGTFRPEASITRAEFAVMLWRAYGEPTPKEANPFSDVPAGEWYDNATAALYELGITSGVGGGLYDPDGTLTREMGMTMLARAFGVEADDADSYKSFADADSISSWAAEAVSALVEKGYTQGKGDNQFAPKDPLKRGEMAKILTEVFDGEGGLTDTDSGETAGDSTIAITLSQSPTVSTSGKVTVTVSVTGENDIAYIGMRTSSSNAVYTDKTGFTDITSEKKFTVSSNGWYAVCAEDSAGAFAYKLIQITNITSSSGGSSSGGGGSKYDVTFDANGGKFANGADTFVVKDISNNSTVGSSKMPANPTKSGYDFVAWNTKTDGTGTAFTSSTKVTGDITVYAIWEKQPSEISYTVWAAASVAFGTVDLRVFVEDVTESNHDKWEVYYLGVNDIHIPFTWDSVNKCYKGQADSLLGDSFEIAPYVQLDETSPHYAKVVVKPLALDADSYVVSSSTVGTVGGLTAWVNVKITGSDADNYEVFYGDKQMDWDGLNKSYRLQVLLLEGDDDTLKESAPHKANVQVYAKQP